MARTKEIWGNLPDVPLIKKNLDEFYRFMYERQTIWVRRFVKRQPPPWTKDPILRDHSFTNVYRELDAGTLWYLNHLYTINKIEMLWRTIVYRLINRVQTFEKVPIISYAEWRLPSRRKLWFETLEELHEQESIFTSAHITLPVGIGRSISRLEKLKEVLGYAAKHLEVIHHDLRHEAGSLEGAFHILRRIPCVGPFIAYEICCDLMYVKYLLFSENDWVNAGPGCKLGIRLISPRTKGDGPCQDYIRHLMAHQQEHFKRLGLKFPYFHKGKKLTLRSIEHSLCEYSKYYRLKYTKAGKVRLFKPKDWPNSTGQLPFRFPRG